MNSFPFLAAASALLLRSAIYQRPVVHNLADFVQSMNWDPAKRGSLMVLEPDSVKVDTKLEGLAAFHRTRTSLTGLSAIIPDTMVVIDDSMQQAPNMYDGLPRHSKVLYLMATLNAGQWEAITGGGLGISDLRTDQKSVFTSIVPKPFKYSSFTVNSKNQTEPIERDLELSDSDLQSVRLHVERSLNFMMPIVGRPGATTGRDTKDDHGKSGDRFVERDTDEDYRKQDSFGVKIRQVVPNQQKASDLDYRASVLSGSIRLKPSERISDLLGRIGQATGLELHADLRVGDRNMACYGMSAPISSVMRVIALSVTGTYRKVGPAYILTSDLTGMGMRKMKLAAYDSDLNAKVADEEAVWRQQIYKSGHLSDIRFRSDDKLTPGDSLMKKLDQGFPGPGAKINSSDLTEGLKAFVQRQNEVYSTQQVTADGAGVESEYGFSYVLPNGDDTKPDPDSLGSHLAFMSRRFDTRPQQEPPSQPRVDLSAIKDSVYLSVTASTAAEARRAVELASRYGFRDLWLDTLSADALTAALQDGLSSQIKVSLVIRPFDYRGVSDDSSADRTLFGDTPPESLKRRMASTEWTNVQSKGWREPEQLGCISPLSTGYQERQNKAIKVAMTPGLAGVRVINSTPHGYNGPRVSYISFPQPLYLEKGNFGYAEDLRLAFIREASIDPIDLVPRGINTNSDLRQPFFLDDGLRGSWSVYDGTDDPNPAMRGMMAGFDTWLAKLNHSCLQSLLEAIAKANPQLPISVDAIPLAMNSLNRSGGGLVEWKSGDPLPEFGEGQRMTDADLSKYVQRTWVADGGLDYAHIALSYMARTDSKRPPLRGLVIDLTSVGLNRVEKWMADTFVASASK